MSCYEILHNILKRSSKLFLQFDYIYIYAIMNNMTYEDDFKRKKI